MTLTIPVTDVCYAFATDVCCAHPKWSSWLAWMIAMLNAVNYSFSVAHVKLFRGAICASRCPKCTALFRGASCAS